MKKFLAILMSAVMLFGLSATAFAIGSPPDLGPETPGEVEVPPKLEKTPEGEGKTKDGESIKVGEWDPKGTDFEDKDEDEVLEDAMGSSALKDALDKLELDPEDLTGSSLGSLTIGDDGDPVTVVFLYGNDGDLVAVLYYFDGSWGETTDIEETDEDSVYSVTFGDEESEDGDLQGQVEVKLEDAEEKDK